MKIKLCAVLVSLCVATPAFADAEHSCPQSTNPAQTSVGDMSQVQRPASEKTRGMVRQELIEAERAGLVPAPKHDYPPSQVAIEHNQKRFHSAETYWASKQQSMQYSKSN
ncbi:hypothetical protein LMG28727_06358 [Paraburkholderia kirstenboschensis]|uniref:DUF4148 domain-containing protein n=1 Tax=Paraburkholderia kirstenboschensis TaxID=1245436 RepID=UPI000B22064B|nr:DUF4148 domain-containing protein [Paraburkholderia kirstenboschensis]CAD6557381.1 hypothetical protein LMG28727_06358 [Paraburkholderia kirstenboschensis]